VGIPLRSTGLKRSNRTSVTTTFLSVFSSIFFATCLTPCDLPTPGEPHIITEGKVRKGNEDLINDMYAAESNDTALLTVILDIPEIFSTIKSVLFYFMY
jgi:hypothetical protein